MRIKFQHVFLKNGILFTVIDGYGTDLRRLNFALVMCHIYIIYATLAVGTLPLLFHSLYR